MRHSKEDWIEGVAAAKEVADKNEDRYLMLISLLGEYVLDLEIRIEKLEGIIPRLKILN